MATEQYDFATRQDQNDGTWNFYSKDGSGSLPWGSGHTSREQAEAEADKFADHLVQRDEIAGLTELRMMPEIAAWADEMGGEFGLGRGETLECIKDGIEAALEDLRSEG